MRGENEGGKNEEGKNEGGTKRMEEVGPSPMGASTKYLSKEK